jgi:hypothetical protein
VVVDVTSVATTIDVVDAMTTVVVDVTSVATTIDAVDATTTVVEEAVNEVAKEVATVEVEIPRLQLLVETVQPVVPIFNYRQVLHPDVAVKANRVLKTNALLAKCFNKKDSGEIPSLFYLP